MQSAAFIPRRRHRCVQHIAYVLSEQATLNINIDNVFDETYRQQLDLTNSPGFDARVGLTLRFGAL